VEGPRDGFHEAFLALKDLLTHVVVRPNDAYTARFPQEMPCFLHVSLRDGRVLVKEKCDYEGFPTHPMRWETVVQKFERLSAPYTDTALRREIVEAVERLEHLQVEELMRRLARGRMHRPDAPLHRGQPARLFRGAGWHQNVWSGWRDQLESYEQGYTPQMSAGCYALLQA
jgi:MmgE/PrpD C-terminal domain